MRRTRVVFLVAIALVPSAAWPQGNPVGPEFRVNTFTTNEQRYASLATDSSGNFVVVWTSLYQDGSYSGVYAQRYASDGSPLGPEFRVNTYTTDDQRYASLAADSSGNFVVVWTSDTQDGSNSGVFAQRYASSGIPVGPEFRVNTQTISFQETPSVAADSSGNFVVVWSSLAQDGSIWGVFGQRYAASGAPLGPEFRVNTYVTYIQARPSVGADSAGNFVVTWESDVQDGSGFGIFAQRYAASGAPLGSEFRVNTHTPSAQWFPSVAADSIGFVVIWDSYGQDGSSRGVFGQRYAISGTTLGAEFRVNTYTTDAQIYPRVAADSGGDFVVVWQDASLDSFGQRYVASGAPLGAQFRINTYTTGFQHNPSVGADSSGNFVVVWSSYPQDGSSWGVFGQRYNMIVPVELMHFRVE
jgi:hypothetical protein